MTSKLKVFRLVYKQDFTFTYINDEFFMNGF